MSVFDTLKKAFGGQKTEPVTESPEEQQARRDKLYIDSINAQRMQKDHFFRTGSYSPLANNAAFTGLNYYPPDFDCRLELPLQPAESREELTIQTSTDDEQAYYRLGTIAFEIDGQPGQLAVYQSPHHDDLFIPFRDATSGTETYGAGRYLEPVNLGDGTLLVDFNLAYNPFCAYSEHYSCPLPPLENWLKIPIRAGEKAWQPLEVIDE